MAESDPPSEDSKFFTYEGPNPKIKYPLDVLYIEDCDGWPLEYCEHHPNYEKAKEWMEKHLTDDMKALYLGEDIDGADGDAKEGVEKKKQKRGGKGIIKAKKKQEKVQKIALSRAPRGKKKFVTVVTGLATYDIDLKKASKFFGSRFACGSSVTGEDEIVIQGDVKDDLFDIIPEQWAQIDEDTIEDLGNQKR